MYIQLLTSTCEGLKGPGALCHRGSPTAVPGWPCSTGAALAHHQPCRLLALPCASCNTLLGVWSSLFVPPATPVKGFGRASLCLLQPMSRVLVGPPCASCNKLPRVWVGPPCASCNTLPGVLVGLPCASCIPFPGFFFVILGKADCVCHQRHDTQSPFELVCASCIAVSSSVTAVPSTAVLCVTHHKACGAVWVLQYKSRAGPSVAV